MDPRLPNLNCYWVVPGRIIAGEYPGNSDREKCRTRIRHHLDCGIATFIDLTEENELVPYREHLIGWDGASADAEHRRFPIRDAGIPRSRDVMVAILDAMDTAAREKPIVYVHCWGGVGRTGTVVGCHLVRHGHTGKAALARLAELWTGVAKYDRFPASPETAEQRAFVLSWTEGRAPA